MKKFAKLCLYLSYIVDNSFILTNFSYRFFEIRIFNSNRQIEGLLLFCFLKRTILKVKFLSNSSILTKKTYHFHEFFTQIFFPIFLVKSKLSKAKKSQTTTFSRVFHPKKFRQFSREIKVEFLDKK